MSLNVMNLDKILICCISATAGLLLCFAGFPYSVKNANDGPRGTQAHVDSNVLERCKLPHKRNVSLDFDIVWHILHT